MEDILRKLLAMDEQIFKLRMEAMEKGEDYLDNHLDEMLYLQELAVHFGKCISKILEIQIEKAKRCPKLPNDV